MTPHQQKADSAIGPVEWINDYQGFITCPGQDLHGNSNSKKDCTVYLDRVPTIYCHHTSCAAPLATLNKKLRQALSGQEHITLSLGGKTLATTTSSSLPVFSPRNRQEYLHRRARETTLRSGAKKKLEDILNDPDQQWTLSEIQHDSPFAPGDEPHEDWHLFLTLFDGMEGELWCGDKYDSGEKKHRENFRSIEEWSLVDKPPAPFTCSALFKPASVSRCNSNVLLRPYLVLESDTLTKGQMGAVLKWFKKCAYWPLRAIIDTGNKSLHGWYDMPPQEWLPDLQITLAAMQMDASMLKPSQPVRLPGYPRGDTFQRLIYYAPPIKSI